MKVYYNNHTEIEALIQGFTSQTLPLIAWTHEAHLTVALWFLYHYSQAEAACLIRSGIIVYNKASGGENSPQKGYHETITLFWIKIIGNYLQNNKSNLSNNDLNDFVTLTNKFLNSEYATRDYLLGFYSREVLFSTQARAFWTEPNRS